MSHDQRAELVISEETHSVTTPHGNLFARVFTTQQSTGTPLIVAHGGPGAPSDYLEPFAQLATDRMVILYDQIGCGRSDQPSDDSVWDVDVFVQHLDRVRATFNLEKFHLYGHSWGGYLALAYAGSHSNHLKTVTLGSPLVDTQRWTDDAAKLIERLPDPHRTVLQAGPGADGYEAAQAEFYRRHFCKIEPWPEALQRAMDATDQRSYHTMWGPNEFTLAPGSVLEGQSTANVAAALEIPNLWLTGSDDEARPESLREFTANNPHSTLEVIPNATHNAHFEEPVLYFDALRNFLNQHNS